MGNLKTMNAYKCNPYGTLKITSIIFSDKTLNSTISGPSQSSYSGLGPGRGASSVRPHSPVQRAVPRLLPTSRPASQPIQTIEHQTLRKQACQHGDYEENRKLLTSLKNGIPVSFAD